MKIVTSAQMDAIDKRAQEEFGIAAYDLMDAAGKAVCEAIEALYHPRKLCIVCGKGNNAGDGFVVAREFTLKGRAVEVVCAVPGAELKGAALQAWNDMVPVVPGTTEPAELEAALDRCDIVVDALLGTGVRGRVMGPLAEAIRAINGCGKQVVSIDMPSGLTDDAADLGDDPVIVRADTTLAIGAAKKSAVTYPGAAWCGKVSVLPINFPAELLGGENLQLNCAAWEEVRGWLPPRLPVSNKGTYGNCGIVGATAQYAGATLLVARAALKAGCGLATIAAIPATAMLYRVGLPEAITREVESDDHGYFGEQSVDSVLGLAEQQDVLCVGPGMGTAPETSDFLWGILKNWHKPLVLDADALNIISGGMLSLLSGKKQCVLTPHPGEMARLTAGTVEDVQNDREYVARDFAVKHQVVVLLKGADTVVAGPDGQVWLVPGAEPALAKGGSGDVLCGVIGSLMAQGMEAWQAAVAAATVHLQAGRQCSAKRGARGLLARELADEIPLAMDL